MALRDIRDPSHVLSAIAECDRRGMEEFLKTYGFKPARHYSLIYPSGRYRFYPSKAILGVAHRFAHPSRRPLRPTDFTGGLSQTLPVLDRLGFRWTGRGSKLPAGSDVPLRGEVTGSRIIRDTAVVRAVKKLHGYGCQLCGLHLVLRAGLYAEGAHIKPLGRPHDGHDTPDNILCLCPNCHVLFDGGAISISDDWQILGTVPSLKGRALRRVSGHTLNRSNIQYHRNEISKSTSVSASVALTVS